MRVQYTCYLHPFTSMGVIAINVVRELTRLGIDVSLHTLNPEKDPVRPEHYSKEIQDALKKGFREDVINIFFSYPDVYPYVRCKVNVGYTGADTYGWYQTENGRNPIDSCNEFMHYMLTPSDYSRRIMQDCGVEIPIELYPHGLNLDIFKPSKREYSKPFKFVYTGELTKRKGAQDLMKAFMDLYQNNPDYQLLLRANTHMMYLESDEIRWLADSSNNIILHWKNEGQNDLVNYLNDAHAFIYPSRADWFGMCPFEALATGMPVIATDSNGYFEFIKDMITPIASHRTPIKSGDHPYFRGEWNEPDQKSLREGMLRVANNYETFSGWGYENAIRIRERFSWKNVTEEYLLPFLEKVWKKHFEVENKYRKVIRLSDLIKNS